MVIFEIAFVAAFGHVYVDGARGQVASNMKVHSHVCCADAVGFRF